MKQVDKVLYQIGWVMIILLLLILFLIHATNISIASVWPPCIFHRFTGLYCPGCGGTRAVTALFQGNFIKSAIDHPLVLYGSLLFVIYMISNTVERLSKGRVKAGFRYSDKWLYLALAIVAVNFIVKDGFLLLFGIDLLK